jgi:hypothetical protein
MQEFIHRNPARVAAFVSSLVALLVTALSPDLPVEQAVVFVLSALGLGEYAQRVEDKKTIEALYTDPEDLEIDIEE